MNLKGICITHKVFGEGEIKLQEGNRLVVSFSQGEKKFPYPDALNTFITINDHEVAKFVKSEVEREEIIKRRNIKHLIHFTRMENLNSILLNGLVPVSMQKKMNIQAVRNDAQRIDTKLNCTSCSVTFPNYKLFYKFRESNPEIIWVVIVLNMGILFSHSNAFYFCKANAAAVLPRTINEKELCTAKAFEDMFCDAIISRDNMQIRRESLKIEDNKTTDPQAEILISGIVDTKYIDYIYFQKQQDINDYTKQNGSEVLSNYVHQIEPEFFKARKDHSIWKRE